MTILHNSHDYQRTLRKELDAHLSSSIVLYRAGNQTHNLTHNSQALCTTMYYQNLVPIIVRGNGQVEFTE